MLYKRLNKSVKSKGQLIPVDNNLEKTIQEEIDKSPESDFYLSIYYYDETQAKLANTPDDSYEKIRGVNNINDVITDKLYLDFDTKEDLETARQSAIKAVDLLKENGFNDDNIDICFSGNKGFSIVANLDVTLKPDEHKNLATNLFGKFPGFDSSIYNASRIFRIPNTRHAESGLYKIQLTEEELKCKSVGAIKTLAVTKRKSYNKKTKSAKLNEVLENAIMEVDVKKPSKDTNTSVTLDLDFSKKPAYLTDTKYVLHQGYIPPGKGNTGMMILAATYKHVGFDDKDAYHLLKSVNERRAEIYGPEHKRDNDEIWLNVVQYVYGPNWNGGTYRSEENELLKEVVETHGIIENSKNIVGISDVKNRFLNFASTINNNIIKTGVKSLDDQIMITTGMLVGVLGSPGSGKTSFASTFSENLSKKGVNSLFLSLDMHDNLLYSRLIQKNSEISVEKLLRRMVRDDKNYMPGYDIAEDGDFIKATKEVQDVYKNVDFNFTRGATVESIEEDIRIAKNKYGNNFKLVVVDYLEKIRSQYSDPTASSGYVASKLSDLASKYDVCILLLLQPQKSAGDAAEELLSMRKVKGASVIEQDCRVILTMWRPGFNPEDNSQDIFASVAAVKNNMGGVSKTDFYWNGLKGQLSELDSKGRTQLKQLLEDKENAKKEEADQKKGMW